MKIKHCRRGIIEVADIPPRTPVLYVGGSSRDPNGEFGLVSSVNHVGNIFVRFEENIRILGFEETTGKACRPEDLILLS